MTCVLLPGLLLLTKQMLGKFFSEDTNYSSLNYGPFKKKKKGSFSKLFLYRARVNTENYTVSAAGSQFCC